MVKGDVKEGKKINVGASASVLPSPDGAVVDLSLHGRGICLGRAGTAPCTGEKRGGVSWHSFSGWSRRHKLFSLWWMVFYEVGGGIRL